MAHLVQRLLQRRPPMIKISSLICQNSKFQTLTPASFSQSIDSRLKSILPSQLPKEELEKTQVKYDFIYPSFSYGLTVNPVFQKVVTEEEEVEEVENGLEKMWTDSTKKKRKRKMNKHKYKKLMKRTRHTT